MVQAALFDDDEATSAVRPRSDEATTTNSTGGCRLPAIGPWDRRVHAPQCRCPELGQYEPWPDRPVTIRITFSSTFQPQQRGCPETVGRKAGPIVVLPGRI